MTENVWHNNQTISGDLFVLAMYKKRQSPIWLTAGHGHNRSHILIAVVRVCDLPFTWVKMSDTPTKPASFGLTGSGSAWDVRGGVFDPRCGQTLAKCNILILGCPKRPWWNSDIVLCHWPTFHLLWHKQDRGDWHQQQDLCRVNDVIDCQWSDLSGLVQCPDSAHRNLLVWRAVLSGTWCGTKVTMNSRLWSVLSIQWMNCIFIDFVHDRSCTHTHTLHHKGCPTTVAWMGLVFSDPLQLGK